MPIKPELVKLRKQYRDAYIPDSDGAMSSESETVMTSVIYEREVGFLLLNLAIGLIVFSYRHLHGQCPITLRDQSPITRSYQCPTDSGGIQCIPEERKLAEGSANIAIPVVSHSGGILVFQN